MKRTKLGFSIAGVTLGVLGLFAFKSNVQNAPYNYTVGGVCQTTTITPNPDPDCTVEGFGCTYEGHQLYTSTKAGECKTPLQLP